MHSRIIKQTLAALAAAGLALASLAAGAATAPGNTEILTPDGVEKQVKAQWKEDASHCGNAHLTQIAKVDLVDAQQYKSWLAKRQGDTGLLPKVVPDTKYVIVSSLSKGQRKEITAYGPVAPNAGATDFRNLVGMHMCDHSDRP
jgi:hypothetical protein